MLTDALLRVRYRALGDTAAFMVDLPADSVVAVVRDDRDLDQVIEWAQLSDDSIVLRGAQLLHASTVLADEDTRLPHGAIDGLRRALAVLPSYPSGRPEIEVRCSLEALSMPSAPRHANPRDIAGTGSDAPGIDLVR